MTYRYDIAGPFANKGFLITLLTLVMLLAAGWELGGPPETYPPPL